MNIIIKVVVILVSVFLLLPLSNYASYDEIEYPKKNERNNIDNLNLIDLYRLEVCYKVRKNWSLSKNSSCKASHETKIVFTILQNGEIRDVLFVERSKCKELDDSAYLAIVESAPFDPFPIGLEVIVVKVGIVFHPDDVR